MFLVDEPGAWHISGESSAETSDFLPEQKEKGPERDLCVQRMGSQSVTGMLQERKSKARSERMFFGQIPSLESQGTFKKNFKRFHPSSPIILSGEKCLYIMHSRQSESKDT